MDDSRATPDSLPLSRRKLVLALLLVPTPLTAAPCRPKVLFVCPAGTVKSPIAREMLKQAAAARGVAVDVRSRGLTPEDHVSEALAARLRADGLNPAAEPALPLTREDVAVADVVVAFDAAAQSPLLPGARAWRTPSWNSDYTAAKADMAARVDALLTELGASCGKARR
jgi:protein-tyrosine-phosphatase